MPRTLPWAVGPSSRKSSTPASSASVNRKSGDAIREPRGPRSLKRSSRTPSTSPPREPPSEQYMVEGLENDDQYIMVEDEFLATAQAFTSYLHHAEYVRRKNQAKIENANKVTDVTRSRPTDGKTPMSRELQSNIQAEKASSRRREALDEMKRAAGRPPVDSELEDEGLEGSDEDGEDDPWIGTSLQPLMVASRQPRSLVGLQGVKSTTKAALGYINTSSQAGMQIQPIQEKEIGERGYIGKTTTAGNNTIPEVSGDAVDDDTASTDDDDLDAIPRPRPQQKLAHPVSRPNISTSGHTATTPRPTTKNPVKKSPNDQKTIDLSTIPMHKESPSEISRHMPRSRQPYKSRFSTFFDDWDESSPTPPSPQIKQEEKEERKSSGSSTPVGFKRIKREGSDDKSRKQRLSEVPTFL